jgi:hypothetical protein
MIPNERLQKDKNESASNFGDFGVDIVGNRGDLPVSAFHCVAPGFQHFFLLHQLHYLQHVFGELRLPAWLANRHNIVELFGVFASASGRVEGDGERG